MHMQVGKEKKKSSTRNELKSKKENTSEFSDKNTRQKWKVRGKREEQSLESHDLSRKSYT